MIHGDLTLGMCFLFLGELYLECPLVRGSTVVCEVATGWTELTALALPVVGTTLSLSTKLGHPQPEHSECLISFVTLYILQ